MKLLAIDTATESCSVALWHDGALLEHYELAGREHSLRLPRMFAELCAEAGIAPAQIDGLVAGIGPGSFAGVRIGLGFVKGLALGLQRPALGVSSLAMLAQGAVRMHGARVVHAAIDARMSQVYAGVYECLDGRARLLDEELVIAPAELPSPTLPACWFAVGSGWKAYAAELASRLTPAPIDIDGDALPHAMDALVLVQDEFAAGRAGDAAALAPNYLRNRVALTQAEQIAARQSR